MRRHLSAMFAGTSFALCVASLAAAVDDRWLSIPVLSGGPGGERAFVLAFDRGVTIATVAVSDDHPDAAEVAARAALSDQWGCGWQPLEFTDVTIWSARGAFLMHGEASAARGRPRWYGMARVPYWMIAVFAVLPPLRWGVRRQWQRQPAGLCAACGYDLRATPGRCPECGREAAAAR